MTAGLQALIGRSLSGAPLMITARGTVTAEVGGKFRPAVAAADVLLSVRDQRQFLAALLAFSGRANRLLILSPALAEDHVRDLAAGLNNPLVVSDHIAWGQQVDDAVSQCPAGYDDNIGRDTGYVLTTSGTTGRPKLVRHSLSSLTAAVRSSPTAQPPVWGLFFDPARFAGLQVVLQSLLGGGTLLAPDTSEPMTRQLAFLAEHGCTHLSATPSLWRRILMAPDFRGLPLRQITLGGEIADQGLLDRLRKSFPMARITHVYASTEAGAVFSVTDGRAGFPASWLEPGPVQRGTIVDGILWVRSAGAATGVLQAGHAEGLIKTGDRVSLSGDRVFFSGREDCIVNIGGVKVSPETVEDVIHAVPGVISCQIVPRPNSVSGNILWATVTPVSPSTDQGELKRAILSACRTRLPREAVPAVIRFAAVDIAPTGKVLRLVS